MAETPFERLARAKMQEIASSLLSVPAQDVARVAMLQGKHAGIREAVELFKQSSRSVDDEEDI